MPPMVVRDTLTTSSGPAPAPAPRQFVIHRPDQSGPSPHNHPRTVNTTRASTTHTRMTPNKGHVPNRRVTARRNPGRDLLVPVVSDIWASSHCSALESSDSPARAARTASAVVRAGSAGTMGLLAGRGRAGAAQG